MIVSHQTKFNCHQFVTCAFPSLPNSSSIITTTPHGSAPIMVYDTCGFVTIQLTNENATGMSGNSLVPVLRGPAGHFLGVTQVGEELRGSPDGKEVVSVEH
jgi:hypothetical protein